MGRICARCGSLLAGTCRRKYCSRRCLEQDVYERRKAAGYFLQRPHSRRFGLRSCEICGLSYRPSWNRQRTCSRTCGEALRRYVTGTLPVAPPDEHTRKGRRRKLEIQAVGLTVTQRYQLLRKWRSQNKRCLYCGGQCQTVDHVVPLNRGGDNREGNLAPACRSCNSRKGDLLNVEWKARDARRRSNPQTQRSQAA